MEVARTKGGKEIEYARCRVAMACKAYQIDAIDTRFTDVNDPEALIVDALNAQTLAMNAKSARPITTISTVPQLLIFPIAAIFLSFLLFLFSCYFIPLHCAGITLHLAHKVTIKFQDTQIF
jgi:hypothetical protein